MKLEVTGWNLGIAPVQLAPECTLQEARGVRESARPSVVSIAEDTYFAKQARIQLEARRNNSFRFEMLGLETDRGRLRTNCPKVEHLTPQC
jgi:hypothetical protein